MAIRGGVVRDGEGLDVELADGEAVAGAEVFDRGEGGGVAFAFLVVIP
jgi:hypothetical protein